LTALVFLLCCKQARADIQPLMRGTLWWVVDKPECPWTKAELRAAVEAQRAVGFDLLWLLNTPALLRAAEASDQAETRRDVLGWLFDVADEAGMRVIVDLPQGGWYGKTTADAMVATMTDYARRCHARYGRRRAFHGWYLNHEINPIAPENLAESAYWRDVWRRVTAACHETAPGSVVTISPFFLLDEARRRGFVYQTPEEYAAWWGETLKQTGIDVLMLQDSGEHLASFTLEQREPFWAATARACRAAGAAFWLNVETGEVDVRDWDEYLRHKQAGTAPWRFTPMPWLAEKLALAAKYAEAIVNWGYFPYMDPLPRCGRAQPAEEESRGAYEAYRAYAESQAKSLTQP